MADEEDSAEGDLSPLTILLIGSIVSAVLFSVIRRILESSKTLKPKFRKRTREEEEALLARQVPQVLAEPEQVANVEDEEFANEIGVEPAEEDEQGEGDDESVPALETTALPGEVPRAMTKKELYKVEKRKKKQEQQEAWRHAIDHQRRLRELREAEEREREEFEQEQDEERKRKAAPVKAKEVISAPSDDDLLNYLHGCTSKRIMYSEICVKYPKLPKATLDEQLERVVSKSRPEHLLLLSNGDVFKIELDDIHKLRGYVRSKGVVSAEDLLLMLTTY